MDFGIFLDVRLIPFSVPARALLNLQKTLFCIMNLNDLTIWKNMIFDDDLFRYLFWHYFLMNLGIDIGSALAPLWHTIPCFPLIFFGDVF